MPPRPTRRDFLEAALIAGAGAAFGSAGRQDGRRPIPARFVGDAFQRGHYWITPDPEKLHVDLRAKAGTVIVGGGIAGVVAAWRLQAASVEDFVLLELEDVPGGLARRGLMGKTVVPFGGTTMMPASSSSSSPAVLRLLETAFPDGLHGSAFAPSVFEAGTWKKWSHGPSIPPASRPAVMALDRSTVREWLVAERSDSERVRFAERWCLLRFGARTTDISAAAFVLDASLRLEAVAVPGGLSALLAPLVAQLGKRFLPARVALLVKPAAGGATVRAVNAIDATVTDYDAKSVVLAVPPLIAARITPVLRERQSSLAVPTTTPWLVTAIMVAEWPKGFDPSVPFHQCTDERAALILHVGTPPEGVIITHRPFPGTAATPGRMFLRDLDPESARDWAFRELQQVFPDLASVATKVELFRVAHGSIRPGPGFMTEIAPRLSAPAPPIYPCGADHAGIPCVESAITEGVRGAEEVLKSLGKLDRSWL